jgi:hypothetical protein
MEHQSTWKMKSWPQRIFYNMKVIILTNGPNLLNFQNLFSLMSRELSSAAAQATCTDDDGEADKTIKSSTNSTRKAMLASSPVGATLDRIGYARVCNGVRPWAGSWTGLGVCVKGHSKPSKRSLMVCPSG